jgi:hypothetical protein
MKPLQKRSPALLPVKSISSLRLDRCVERCLQGTQRTQGAPGAGFEDKAQKYGNQKSKHAHDPEKMPDRTDIRPQPGSLTDGAYKQKNASHGPDAARIQKRGHLPVTGPTGHKVTQNAGPRAGVGTKTAFPAETERNRKYQKQGNGQSKKGLKRSSDNHDKGECK